MSWPELALVIITALATLFGVDLDTLTQESSVNQDEEFAQVVSIADGDTITVLLNGQKERIRYIGIDTPEMARDGRKEECFAEEARERNGQLVAGETVRLVADKENTDRYDRLLRYVYVDDVLVQEVLLSEGYATTIVVKPNVAQRSHFADLQSAAKDAKVGLWEGCR